MLKSKKESINWKVTKPLILPFSGMLECGCCGKHYSRKTTPYKHTVQAYESVLFPKNACKLVHDTAVDAAILLFGGLARQHHVPC